MLAALSLSQTMPTFSLSLACLLACLFSHSQGEAQGTPPARGSALVPASGAMLQWWNEALACTVVTPTLYVSLSCLLAGRLGLQGQALSPSLPVSFYGG